jgi:hypothetical protein
MKKLLLLPVLLTLAACEAPILSGSLRFGPDGMSVNPALSGKVGNATVTIE